jgi:hypothetical protein
MSSPEEGAASPDALADQKRFIREMLIIAAAPTLQEGGGGLKLAPSFAI